MPSGAFGQVLSRIRQERGFATAHAFYRARKGRHWMGLSFASYLALEKGRSLPRPSRLARLVELLGLQSDSEQAKELARSYLVCLAGEEPLRLAGFEDSGEGRMEGATLAELAARQAISQRTAQLTVEQWKTLGADYAAYSCWAFLVNTPGWTGADEASRAAGLSAAQGRKALQALSEAGLVEVSQGRCRSPFAGKAVPPLPPVPETSTIRAAIIAHRRRWTETDGKLTHTSQITVRLPRARLKSYLRHIDEALKLGAVYGDVQRGSDTAVFLVDARVFEIFR